MGVIAAGGGDEPINKRRCDGESLGEIESREVGEEEGKSGLSGSFKIRVVGGEGPVNNGSQAFAEDLTSSVRSIWWAEG